ncbi:MAG: sigma 54-interacting transcriptional regulator [Clostridiales bacterium]
MTYHITQISSDPLALIEIPRQLKDLLGDSFEIKGLAYGQLSSLPPIRDDLVLITAPAIASWIIPYVHPDTKYIILQRTLNPQHLNRMLDLPPGSEVLVVNSFITGAYELIEELLELDLPPNKYFPYDPLEPDASYSLSPAPEPDYYNDLRGVFNRQILQQYERRYPTPPYSGRPFRYAITAGDAGVVPSDISTIIDLGQRSISILTVAEILQHFTGSATIDDRLVRRYHRGIIDINMELHKQIRLNEELHRQLAELLGNTNQELAESALNMRDMERQRRVQQKAAGCRAKYTMQNIVHHSAEMKQLISKAKAFATSDATILISGESGTGKELLAQAIHNASPRRQSPFVAVNCSALTESLLESELFGYEEGAFTGAKKGGKKGLLELAHTGTLFLDEIGDASPAIQTKLLRSLQEKEVFRVGGDKTIPVNLRIIAATHQDLRALVAEGKFRQDLYYRLSVLPLHVPPLRQRKDDILPLLSYFMSQSPNKTKAAFTLSRKMESWFREYSWAGNVRELENVVEYMMNTPASLPEMESELCRLLHLKDRQGQQDRQDQQGQQDRQGRQDRQGAGIPPANGAASAAEATYAGPVRSRHASAATAAYGRPGQTEQPAGIFPTFSASPILPTFPSIAAKEQCHLILNLLHHSHLEGVQRLSRQQLGDLLAAKGLRLSTQQIKSRVAILADYALVESKVGCGTWITEKGLAFCRQENPQENPRENLWG